MSDGRVVELRAHAKINLRLRVLARETSGYHQLETLFLLLELADDVRVRVGGRGRSLETRGADVGPVEQNLAWRAATALADAGGPSSFAIEIEKRIPVGGGLGGGSADAAAVLRALNGESRAPLPPDELLSLATTLGADVPFLTAGIPFALAWGRGERLLTLRPPPAADVLIAAPSFGIATADAYAWLAEARERDATPAAQLLDPRDLARWDPLAARAVNDFEPVVEARHPELATLRGVLAHAGANVAMLAGSGSSVFGIFPGGPAPAVPAAAPPGVTLVPTRTIEERSHSSK